MDIYFLCFFVRGWLRWRSGKCYAFKLQWIGTHTLTCLDENKAEKIKWKTKESWQASHPQHSLNTSPPFMTDLKTSCLIVRLQWRLLQRMKGLNWFQTYWSGQRVGEGQRNCKTVRKTKGEREFSEDHDEENATSHHLAVLWWVLNTFKQRV